MENQAARPAFQREAEAMNWKKIHQAWESGDRRIAVRLLECMIYQLDLRQCSLAEVLGGVKRGD